MREIDLSKQYGVNPDPEVLDIVETVAKSKGAKVVAKLYWGDAREKLCYAVDDLKLDCLVIGSRGLSAIKRSFYSYFFLIILINISLKYME